MKHIKNIARGAAVLAMTMVASMPAMAQDNYVPKNEFSISGFGGLSSLQYKVDGLDHKLGFGGGAGFDWTYHFSKHWGIRLGLQGALYQGKVKSDKYIYTYEKYGDYAEIGSQFQEKQKALYAQVPLMVQWMTSAGKHNFYIALGGKFGYRIWDNFKQKVDFIDGEGFDGERSVSNQNYIDLKRINAMGSAELGMRWTLGNGVGLYTGLYFDYGFLKVNDKKATTASIINAVDYNYNEDGRRNVEAQRAVDKVNTMAGGLILRLSFGKPAVIAPVCEPCPGPQTVIREKHITIHDTIYVEKEVPQEIKQKMKDLSNALFAFDKFNINTKAASILDDIAGWMKQNPDMKLELSGHTDGKGSVDYNQKLSEQRAKAVYDYLVKAGVSKTNLTWKGYGKSEPIATNDTAEGRQLNRRVELRIVK